MNQQPTVDEAYDTNSMPLFFSRGVAPTSRIAHAIRALWWPSLKGVGTTLPVDHLTPGERIIKITRK